jgi:hypothetical protein
MRLLMFLLDLGHCKKIVDFSGLRKLKFLWLEVGRIIVISPLSNVHIEYLDNDHYRITDFDDDTDVDDV